MPEVSESQRAYAEFFGTAFFTFVVLSATSSWMVGVGLIAAIVAVGGISGGNLNPAISTAMYMQKKITGKQWVYYVAVQMLGAAAGTLLYALVNNGKWMMNDLPSIGTSGSSTPKQGGN